MYSIIKGILWFLFRLVYFVRITGRENIPKEGAFILCGNHIHMFDGPVLLAITPRRLALMAKKELFKIRIFAAIFSSAGVFPIDRKATADMAAYRHTMQALENGQGLLIFSQGTRMKAFENAKSGVAMFALRSGAPIIPVGLSGTYRPLSRLNINIGTPITMEAFAGRKIKADVLEEVMALVVPRVADLTK